MRSAEGSGRTVEEAIREALRILGARREDVDLMVLDEGSRGVLGLGSRTARVRLTLLSEMEESAEAVPAASRGAAGAPPVEVSGERAQLAQSIASALIEAMGFRAAVSAREEGEAVLVSIAGPELAPLIGRRGQTLEALDLLVNLMVAHRQGQRVPVVVDVERYRERRLEVLQEMAWRLAERVRKTGRPTWLKPMSAAERRIIHTTLAEDGSVVTHSEGEEPDRRVVITPRTVSSPAAAPQAPPTRPGRSRPQTTDDARQ